MDLKRFSWIKKLDKHTISSTQLTMLVLCPKRIWPQL